MVLTGRHTVEILYAGQAIMGSPFYVEIYDPNKIRVEGTRKGMVSQRMEFDSRPPTLALSASPYPLFISHPP